MTPTDTCELAPPLPWWRFPMVWFALAGPALVIVAGLATVAIAYRHADVAVEEGATAASAGPHAGPTAPALQARNHAATPPARP